MAVSTIMPDRGLFSFSVTVLPEIAVSVPALHG